MEYKLDMGMMFALHDALRRELVQVTRIAAVRDDNPGPMLRAALGWELFKKFLTVHHQTEDDVLWPALRAQVAGHPDRLALADALEAEHAVIEPLLTAIDAAAADPDYGYQRLGDITDELAVKLTAHLTHEENDGLALIDASLTRQQWQAFAHAHGQRLGGDAPMYMPWLLNGASPQTQDQVMGNFPPPLLAAYRDQWSPAYAALTIWPAAQADMTGQPAGQLRPHRPGRSGAVPDRRGVPVRLPADAARLAHQPPDDHPHLVAEPAEPTPHIVRR
jgi:hypothetical protein